MIPILILKQTRIFQGKIADLNTLPETTIPDMNKFPFKASDFSV